MMDSTIESPASLSTLFLDQPPSCLAFCPTAPDHVLISTYLLIENPAAAENSTPESVRTGSLQLFRFDPHLCHLSPVQKLYLDSAVFDFQFSPRDPTLFAVVLSTPVVSLYRIEGPSGEPNASVKIVFVRSINVHENASQLALFLAWIPSGGSSRGENDGQEIKDGFAVSFSDGRVSVLCTDAGIESTNEIAISEIRFTGYPIEVWYVAFYLKTVEHKQIPVLFAGDDMQHVRGVTLEEIECAGNVSSRAWQLDDRGRCHDAGVTAIVPLFADEVGTILLTGSYDEHIRVYHFKPRSEVLASKNIGGGVWRLRLIKIELLGDADKSTPSQWQLGYKRIRSYLVLASCMHGGARLLRVNHSVQREDDEGQWEIDVTTEFKEHQSMNYASDFYKGRKGGFETDTQDRTVLCVTSSFYDKRVCVWKAST
ncbi:uncharacterized protein CIMG_12005 [Coccidioides immitis RS]|uniref:WD repeat protein n=1 Tax=Coccidioides immitis (strain RS) TaxID=246410 RepID=A0A0D8JU84_COCIM|nr:uncharacterized protein CIMG_12005 [Coccidioides immitis RS]KJF60910.1 hypothetical protein CIMG_12005 [Coccidioides immitis RS]